VQTVANARFFVKADRFEELLKVAERSTAYLEQALKAAEVEPPSLERARLLTALALHVGTARSPRDTEAGEKYARAAVEVAEKLDAPTELSAALGALDYMCFLRARWRDRVEVSQQRLRVSRDPRLSDLREQAMALIDAGNALSNVGEYAEALPNLVEAERLAAEGQMVELEKEALTTWTDILFRLDRWDEVLQLDDRLRDMQRRYPLEKIGASCYSISVVASVHALRGEAELATRGREEAQAIMTSVSGPPENWSRFEHH